MAFLPTSLPKLPKKLSQKSFNLPQAFSPKFIQHSSISSKFNQSAYEILRCSIRFLLGAILEKCFSTCSICFEQVQKTIRKCSASVLKTLWKWPESFITCSDCPEIFQTMFWNLSRCFQTVFWCVFCLKAFWSFFKWFSEHVLNVFWTCPESLQTCFRALSEHFQSMFRTVKNTSPGVQSSPTKNIEQQKHRLLLWYFLDMFMKLPRTC